MLKKIFKLVIQRYLRFLTRITLWRHKPLVISVAGTSNKTFTKDTILDELGRGPEVRGNPKSFNTEIGLPLAVLFLPSGYSSIFKWVDVLLTGTTISIFSRKFPKILVLEMGVDRKGDMEYLLSMVKPKVAIVTDINRGFYETNTTRKDIFNEISLLVEKLPNNGLAILNGEDVWARNLESAARKKAKTIVFGEDEKCDVKISEIEDSASGQKFVLEMAGQKETIETDRYGRHNINALVIAKILKRELERMNQENKK